jgi:hypothetical protein
MAAEDNQTQPSSSRNRFPKTLLNIFLRKDAHSFFVQIASLKEITQKRKNQ